jgi:plastocyanin
MLPRGAAAVLLAIAAACSSAPPPPQPAAKKAEYFEVNPQTAATVIGKVSFRGAKPRRQPIRIDEDFACVQMNKAGLLEESVIVGAGRGLSNVFVYVKRGLEGKVFAPAPPTVTVTIDQKSCRFAPHVLGTRVGQILRVTNSDPLTHNIHPQAKMNREWNQSQEQGAPALERKFVRPEAMIRVKCNVHSWMRAYVGVIEHPYFAVSDAGGSFEIKGLPPGDYVLEAWQEKLGSQEIPVHLEPAAAQRVAISFTPGV